MGTSLLRLLALIPFVILGAVACGSEEQSGTADQEPRTVTRTVTETVAEPEEEEPEAAEETAEPTQSSPGEAAAEPPEETLEQQYRYINSGQYEEAYLLFAPQSQQVVSLDQYVSTFQDISPYEISNYTFISTQVQGETADITVDLTVYSGPQRVQQYQITQEMALTDAGWKVVMRDAQIDNFTSTSSLPEPDTPPDQQDRPDDVDEGTSTELVTIRVTGSEPFTGNYGTLDSSRSVDGVAPAEYQVEVDSGMFSVDSVSAVMQKSGPGTGELGVEVIVDGEVVRETSTTAGYGVASVSWSPAE